MSTEANEIKKDLWPGDLTRCDLCGATVIGTHGIDTIDNRILCPRYAKMPPDPAGEMPKMIMGMEVPNFWMWLIFNVTIIGIILVGFLS
jgi:hypothetical protein